MKKAADFYGRKPIISLIIILIIIIFFDLIILPFTKKSKMITIQFKNSTNYSGRYRSPTMNYVLVDEMGDNYTYDYNGLLQILKLQKTRYNEYLTLKEGDRVKVTYYGIFTKSILDIEKV
jgi:hypothetical protein